MTAGKYNLIIDQGSDFGHIFTINQNVNGVKTPRDLSGWQARASMRPTFESTTSHDFDCVVIKPELAGKIKMSLPAARSTNIEAGIYQYDLEIYKASNVTRILQGVVTLTREVTR